MLRGIKLRLFPTETEEKVLMAHVNAARAVWNWGLAFSMNYFEETGKYVGLNKLSRELTQVKKTDEKSWLNEVSSQTTFHALRDLDKAYKWFFKKQKKGVKFSKKTIAKATRQKRKLTPYDMLGHPKFKKKDVADKKFYVRYDRFYVKNGNVNLETIGKVKFKSQYDIPSGKGEVKFSNPRVSFVSGKWILSVGVEFENQEYKLKDFSVGADVGIKEFATVSYDGGNKIIIHNVNKELRVKKLKKRLRREQRRASKSQRPTREDKEIEPSNSYKKHQKKVAEYYGRLANIRRDHVHKASRKIVDLLPSRIVIEDLNVSGMMKNEHLSRAISEQCWSEFFRQIVYKAQERGIEVIKADRFYPSSKTCSNCGHVKGKLKLSERIYHCEVCGFTEDRDFNAARNLERYVPN